MPDPFGSLAPGIPGQEDSSPPQQAVDPYMQALAQAAREMAARRMMQAVQPVSGRQEGGISAWIDNQGTRMADQIGDVASDFVHHPEYLIGGGEMEAPLIGVLRSRFSPAIIARFRELVSAGKTTPEIASELKILPTSVNSLARETGMMRGNAPVRTEADKAHLLELLKGTQSQFDIAREMGMSQGAVAQYAKKLGLSRRE